MNEPFFLASILSPSHTNIYSRVKLIYFWRFCMKNIPTIIIFISLLYLPVVFAEDVSVDQLKRMMTASADNLTTYTYTRSAESTIIYSNESLQDKFAAVKATEG